MQPPPNAADGQALEGPYRSNEARDAPPRAWIEGDHLALRTGKRLPSICLKCGQTDAMRWTKHTFAARAQPSLGRQVLFGALFGALGAAVAGASARGPRATMELPFCGRCGARRANRAIVALLYLLAFLAGLFALVATVSEAGRGPERWISLLALLALVAGLVLVSRWARAAQVHAVRVEARHVVLGGVDPAARDASFARRSEEASHARPPPGSRKRKYREAPPSLAVLAFRKVGRRSEPDNPRPPIEIFSLL